MSVTLAPADWVALLMHFGMLSLLAVGGAITTAPEMQRYLVHERGWLNAEQFTASVAIAQSAPGPNILFVALMGLVVLNIGLDLEILSPKLFAGDGVANRRRSR